MRQTQVHQVLVPGPGEGRRVQTQIQARQLFLQGGGHHRGFVLPQKKSQNWWAEIQRVIDNFMILPDKFITVGKEKS